MNTIKELFEQVDKTTNIAERIDLLSELAKKLLQKNPQKAEETAQELLSLSKRHDNKQGMVHAYLILGTLRYKALELDDAEQYFNTAHEVLADTDDKMLKHRIDMSLGKLLWARSEHQQAMQVFERILPQVASSGDKLFHAELLSNVGNVHERLGDPDMAVKYYKEALALLEGTDIEDEGLYIRSNLAIMQNVKGNFTEGIKELLVCLEGFKKRGDTRDVAIVRINMAIAYCEMKLYAESLNEYQLSIKLLKGLNDERTITTVQVGISYVYMYLKGYKEAITHAQKSIDVAREIGYPVGIFDGLLAMSKAYLAKGEPRKAQKAYAEAKQLANEKGLEHVLARHQEHEKALAEA